MQKEKNPVVWFSAACVVIAVIGALLFQRGGYMHLESLQFLQNYTDDRGFLQKIFDPQKNDWGFYQAREFSYIVDWLDSQLVWLTISLGAPLFYQFTHFLGIAAIAIASIILTRRFFPALSLSSATLFALLFMTSPTAFLSGNYFRSSKIIVSVCLMAVVWLLHARLAKGQGYRRFLFFGIALVMSLSDRLGFFMCFLVVAALLAHSVLFRRRFERGIAIEFLGAAAVATIYNLLLAPWLIWIINGQRVDFSYQTMDWTLMFKKYHYYYYSLHLVVDHVRFYFGNMYKQFAVLFCFLLLFAFALPGSVSAGAGSDTQNPWLRGLARVGFVFVIFVMVASLYAGMQVRHKALVWPCVRRIYYWLPTSVLILYFVTSLAAHLASIWPQVMRFLPVALFISFLANLYMLPHHDVILRVGFCKNYMAAAPRLRACLVNKTLDISKLDLSNEERGLCEYVRKRTH